MGVCVQTLVDTCMISLDELASTIEGEMKGIVGGHVQSGKALGAIHIEGGGGMTRFVGGTRGEGTLHLYFLNDGNGNRIIYPRRKKALRFHDGSLHGSARPYKGIHFVEEIAARHGG